MAQLGRFGDLEHLEDLGPETQRRANGSDGTLGRPGTLKTLGRLEALGTLGRAGILDALGTIKTPGR